MSHRSFAITLGVFSVMTLRAFSGPVLLQPHGFGPPLKQYTPDDGLALSGVYPLLADEDGDGDLDLFSMNRAATGDYVTGTVDLRRNDGSGRFGPATQIGAVDAAAPVILTGDVDGDGKADLLYFYRSAFGHEGDVYVRVRGAAGYAPALLWHNSFCFGTEVPVVGDFNGDGRDDIATCTRGTSADVYVALSNGVNAFSGSGVKWHDYLIVGNSIPLAADVNGDGTDELIEVDRDEPGFEGDVWVAFSGGSSFQSLSKWHDFFCLGSEIPRAADINGDGHADMLTFTSDGNCYCATSNAVSAFTGTGDLWHSEVPAGGGIAAGRVNGDLNADILTVTAGPAGSFITTCLSGGHAVPEESDDTDLESRFGMGTMGVPYAFNPIGLRSSRESRWTIVALVTYTGAPGGMTTPDTFTTSPSSYWQTLFFGGGPNVSSYFYEMSAGALELKNAGVLQVSVPWALGPAGVKQALHNAGFDFAAYDSDSDGVTEDNELLIAAITDRNSAAAVTSWWTDPSSPAGPGAVQVVSTPGGDVHVACGVAACDYNYAGGKVYGPAREIARLLGCADLTYPWVESPGASLMSAPSLVHLDAWHKMRLGWLRPDVYDVRRGYPGSETVELPQLAATRAHPPLLFYNSLRGTFEKMMVEYRSHTWFNGYDMSALPSPHPGANNKAGYDSWVPDRGMLLWNVPCFGDHGLDLLPTINPGPDGVINSLTAGDDVYSSRLKRIFSGPDIALDSTASGDDFAETIQTMTTQFKSSGWNLRGDTKMLNAASVLAEPEWIDGSAMGLTFRASENWHGSDRGTVHWGRNSAGPRGKFAPFISRLTGRISNRTFAPGATITLEGSMGVDFAGGPQPVLHYQFAPASPAYPAVTGWSQESVTFSIPGTAPEGRALVYFNDLAGGGEVISNVWEIEIVNCWLRWAQTYFSPAQLSNPDVSGPMADPDMDGLSNAAEYALGVPPTIFTRMDDVLFQSYIRDGSGSITGAQIMWDERSDLDCGGYVEVETSTDLQSWMRRETVSSLSPFPTFVRKTATITGSGPRFFARLVSFYDPNGRIPSGPLGELTSVTHALRGEIWPDYEPETGARRWVCGWIGSYENTSPTAVSGLNYSVTAAAPQTYMVDHSIPLLTMLHPSPGRTEIPVGSLNPGDSGLYILRTSVPWNTAPGTMIESTAVLTAGLLSSTHSSSVTVPILAPAISSHISGTTCRTAHTLAGTAQPGVLVDIYEDATLRGTATALADGSWTLPVSFAPGTHIVSAIARFGSLVSDPGPSLNLVVDPTRFWDPAALILTDDSGYVIRPSGRLDENGWSVFMRNNHTYTFHVTVCCPDPAPLVTVALPGTTIVLTDPDGDRVFTGNYTVGTIRIVGDIDICVTCGATTQCGRGSVLVD